MPDDRWLFELYFAIQRSLRFSSTREKGYCCYNSILAASHIFSGFSWTGIVICPVPSFASWSQEWMVWFYVWMWETCAFQIGKHPSSYSRTLFHSDAETGLLCVRARMSLPCADERTHCYIRARLSLPCADQAMRHVIRARLHSASVCGSRICSSAPG